VAFWRKETVLAPANAPTDWPADVFRDWPAPRNLVVGESHYPDALRKLAGPPRAQGYLIPVDVRFERDPDNAYDRNAFRAAVQGFQVGHLSAELAAQLAGPLDDAGHISFSVCGVIRGGTIERPNLGVHVWLERRLSPGPEISFGDDSGLVSNWPPRDDEG
jgi:hypothetical protein